MRAFARAIHTLRHLPGSGIREHDGGVYRKHLATAITELAQRVEGALGAAAGVEAALPRCCRLQAAPVAAEAAVKAAAEELAEQQSWREEAAQVEVVALLAQPSWHEEAPMEVQVEVLAQQQSWRQEVAAQAA